MQLDIGRASRVLAPIARDLGTNVEAAAMGIVRLANEHMAQALRVISIQRGIDARNFTLVSFGGAGGLHVCALAESLGMREAVVPVYGGVLSALGMLAARRGRTLVKTLSGELAAFPDRTLNKHYAALEKQGRLALEKEGVPASSIEILREVDLRYRGQSYTLPLPWTDVAAASRAFHLAHEQRYGHALERPVELVNLRVGIQGPQPGLPLQYQETASKTQHYPRSRARLYGIDSEVPVLPRLGLDAGDRLVGPALVTEVVSTTLIEPGWECRVADCGNLVLRRTE